MPCVCVRDAGAATEAFLHDLIAGACAELAPGEKLTARGMCVAGHSWGEMGMGMGVGSLPSCAASYSSDVSSALCPLLSVLPALLCAFCVASAAHVRRTPKLDFLADVAEVGQ